MRVLPRTAAVARRPLGRRALRADAAARAVQLRARVPGRNDVLAKRSVHLAGRAARPVRLRGVLQRAAAGAAGHVPALLFPPHVVADARHRLSGDAVVRDDPAHRALGPLRASVPLVRRRRPHAEHAGSDDRILDGWTRDARAARHPARERGGARGGHARQRDEARAVVLHRSGDRPGCGRGGDGRSRCAGRSRGRRGRRRELGHGGAGRGRGIVRSVLRAGSCTHPRADAGAEAAEATHREDGRDPGALVPVPRTLRAVGVVRLGAVRAAVRRAGPRRGTGRRDERSRGVRRRTPGGRRRSVDGLHDGLGRVAGRARRASRREEAVVRHAERRAVGNARHDGGRRGAGARAPRRARRRRGGRARACRGRGRHAPCRAHGRGGP